MQRILITGANKGVGLACAAAILEKKSDVCVLLGSRNLKRGLAAREILVKAHPVWAERIEVLEIDVSNDASVARASAEVQDRFGRNTPLYGLVNNAGTGFGVGDMESVLQVNVRGIQRVCAAFIPLIDPKHGRVVNVTSAAGPNFVSGCSKQRQHFFLNPKLTWCDLDDFMSECSAPLSKEDCIAKGLSSDDPYGFSKACANSYTLIVARETPLLAINACTPGFIDTDLTRTYAGVKGIDPSSMGMKPPSEGTRSVLHLLFGVLEGNGRYYGSDAVRSPLHCYRAPGDPAYKGN